MNVAMIALIFNHYNQRVFDDGQYFTDGSYIYFALDGKLVRVIDIAVIRLIELHDNQMIVRTNEDYNDWHLKDSGAEY